MTDVVFWVLLTAYAWLLVEITVFPIPSEASTLQLLTRDAPDGSSALARARSRAPWIKAFMYLLPTAFGVLCFLVPLAAIFDARVIEWAWPIAAPAWLAIAGCVLVAAGRFVTFASVIQLRRRGSAARPGLQPRGLFAWSRNPGLVGMYAFYLGNCLIFPCLLLVVGFVPYLWNMHRRVVMEESWLLANHGEHYADYIRRVPRYLVF